MIGLDGGVSYEITLKQRKEEKKRKKEGRKHEKKGKGRKKSLISLTTFTEGGYHEKEEIVDVIRGHLDSGDSHGKPLDGCFCQSGTAQSADLKDWRFNVSDWLCLGV
jgi:hypothetical protein